MKRHIYKGYVIDTDNLGRPYIYNTASKYDEQSDHILVNIDNGREYTQIKKIIDERISTGQDVRMAMISPRGEIIVE